MHHSVYQKVSLHRDNGTECTFLFLLQKLELD
jgi:hypothetical protein